MIGSLRELVYALRPPALDDLGFVGALRLQSDRIARDSGLTVDLRVPDELTLPAAVEVAALRTVVEAMTNVVRHSDARTVRIAIEHDGGRSHADGHRRREGAPPLGGPGSGCTGMRERAEELGGTFRAGPAPDGGSGPGDLPDDGCARHDHASSWPTTTRSSGRACGRCSRARTRFRWSAEADNGLDAVRLCVEHRPDVVADGPSAARPARHRGHAAGPHGVAGDCRPRAHHVRGRRHGLRCGRGRGGRLPAQGLRRRRHRRSGTCRGGWPGGVRLRADQPFAGLVRAPAHDPRRTTLSRSSPTASARSSTESPPASPTPRSAPGSSSRPRPSRTTSPPSSPNFT